MYSNDLLSGLAAAEARQPNAFLLRLWRALADGSSTFPDFCEAVRRRRRLTYLTIDTTGACDLTCSGMCYYHPEISLRKNPVAEPFLRRAIDDAANELSLAVLSFAGKEPFLNAPRLFSLIEYAGSLRSRPYSIGIVTNGRHVERHAARLSDLAAAGYLDYIDVSIDSADPREHDQLRGINGTHDLATSAVRFLNADLPQIRTTVPSVLRRENRAGVLGLIKLLSPYNRNFQIQPIQPPPNSPYQPLSPADILHFMDSVTQLLAGPLSGAGIEVSIELLGVYLLEAAQRGFFAWSELTEDENDTLYVEHEIGGNSLILTCELFPLQAWRLARIMYNGSYIAHMHFLQSPHPERFRVGLVQDTPISELFDLSMAPHSHFSQIIESRSHHECTGRPCWRNCFGVWNGAENAFLENSRKLTEQPRLCTKGEDDLVHLAP